MILLMTKDDPCVPLDEDKEDQERRPVTGEERNKGGRVGEQVSRELESC